MAQVPIVPADPEQVRHVDLESKEFWAAVADSVLGGAVAAGEIPGATVVVVNREGLVFKGSFGVSNLETMKPVTDSTLFEVGSIGKALTAIAVLQQVESGRLDLHADVNSYLTNWKIDYEGESPITLHHLLTHTAGLNDRAIGYAARDPSEVEPLGSHLADHFPAPFAPPGRYVSYSNYGFGLAGFLVESVTQVPFPNYVANEVLQPLGMSGSGYRPNVDGSMARGYSRSADGFRAAADFYRHVTPAGSFLASARDMATILKALLNEGTPILSGESVSLMAEAQHTQHELLMGNSYGLEESRWAELRAFGKGGSIPGFASYMAIIPEKGVGLFVAANTGSDDAIDRFVTAALGTSAAETLDGASLPRIDVSRFAGEYRSNRYDRTSIEKLLRMEIHNIYTSGDGSLALWHDGEMNRYQPIDELTFRNTDDPNRFLVFEKDEQGDVTHAFFNERFAGGYVPVVWDRNRFWNSNTYVNEYFGVVGLVALSYLLFPLVLVVGAIRRRLKPVERRASRGRWLHMVGFVTSALVLIAVLLYFVPLLKARPELIFGIPANVKAWSILLWMVVLGFVAFTVIWLKASRNAGVRRPALGYGLVFIASGVLLCEFCVL